MFAILKTLGSPSESDFKEWEKIMTNFDHEYFQEFKNYKSADLHKMFSWIKDLENLLDLLKKMFDYIPNRRISAEEALSHPFFADVKKRR